MQNISKATKLTKVASAAVSGGGVIECTGVDMQGWEGVMFFGSIASIHTSNFAKAQQGADNSADWQDLTGTKVVPTVNGNSFCIDVYKPGDRYVRCYIDRGGLNTATGDVYALQYGPRLEPVASQGSTINAETHVSPVEGVA